VGLALFVRWNIRHHEIHPMQFASLHGRARYGDVPAMHWIESPAEKSDVHAGSKPRLVSRFMQKLASRIGMHCPSAQNLS
jgi:hypothetical protein